MVDQQRYHRCQFARRSQWEVAEVGRPHGHAPLTPTPFLCTCFSRGGTPAGPDGNRLLRTGASVRVEPKRWRRVGPGDPLKTPSAASERSLEGPVPAAHCSGALYTSRRRRTTTTTSATPRRCARRGGASSGPRGQVGRADTAAHLACVRSGDLRASGEREGEREIDAKISGEKRLVLKARWNRSRGPCRQQRGRCRTDCSRCNLHTSYQQVIWNSQTPQTGTRCAPARAHAG